MPTSFVNQRPAVTSAQPGVTDTQIGAAAAYVMAIGSAMANAQAPREWPWSVDARYHPTKIGDYR